MTSLFSKSRVVKELSPKDFDSVSTWKLKDKDCCAVMFYAPWCPHCHNMKDEWEKFASLSAGVTTVYALDCEKEKIHISKIKEDMPELVSGYPTLVFYKNGEPQEQHKEDRKVKNLMDTGMRVCQQKTIKKPF